MCWVIQCVRKGLHTFPHIPQEQERRPSTLSWGSIRYQVNMFVELTLPDPHVKGSAHPWTYHCNLIYYPTSSFDSEADSIGYIVAVH